MGPRYVTNIFIQKALALLCHQIPTGLLGIVGSIEMTQISGHWHIRPCPNYIILSLRVRLRHPSPFRTYCLTQIPSEPSSSQITTGSWKVTFVISICEQHQSQEGI